MVSPGNFTSEEPALIWRVFTHNWVLLLICWSKFSTTQKHLIMHKAWVMIWHQYGISARIPYGWVGVATLSTPLDLPLFPHQVCPLGVPLFLLQWNLLYSRHPREKENWISLRKDFNLKREVKRKRYLALRDHEVINAYIFASIVPLSRVLGDVNSSS